MPDLRGSGEREVTSGSDVIVGDRGGWFRLSVNKADDEYPDAGCGSVASGIHFGLQNPFLSYCRNIKVHSV